MPTETELMTALRNAHDNGDEDGARRIAGMVQELKSQPKVDPAVPAGRSRRSDMVNRFLEGSYAAVLGVGQGFGGAGDYAGMLGGMVNQAATGKPVSAHAAYQMAKENRELIAARNPTNYTIGNVGGLLAGGRLVARTTPSLAAAEGQGAANLARMAGSGAAAGGLQAAGEGGDPTDIVHGIEGGAAGGLVGGTLGRVASPVVNAVAARLPGLRGGSLNARAVAELEPRIGMTADELENEIMNFQRQNGRPASIADVLGFRGVGHMKQLASKQPAFGAPVAEEVERRAVLPPKSQTSNRNQPLDLSTLETARTERMSAAMGQSNNPQALRNSPVDARALSKWLKQPKVQQALRGDTELAQVVEDVIGGNRTHVRLDDLENLRQALGKAEKSTMTGNSIRGTRIGELKDQVEAFATTQFPRYGKALDRYRLDSREADAFEAGRGGKVQGNVTDPGLRASLRSPEGQAAYRVGASERRAAENLSSIAPDYVKPADKLGGSTIAHAAASATSGSWAFKAYHMIRAIPTLKAPDDVLRRAAAMLVDPREAPQGITLLRSAGARKSDIDKLTAAVAGARAGQAAVEQQ